MFHIVEFRETYDIVFIGLFVLVLPVIPNCCALKAKNTYFISTYVTVLLQ